MKIAVIGAGFGGMGLCTYLIRRGVQVDLYDQQGAGLAHPYVGESLRRTRMATAALQELKDLLSFSQQFSEEKVADFSGIIRKPLAENEQVLEQAIKEFGDVQKLADGSFWIQSGITVHSRAYLQGLYAAFLAKGGQFKKQKVHIMDELCGYDFCFFAVGAGVFFFPEMAYLQLKPVKGQALVCKWPKNFPVLEKSLL
jgi:glycine/D-amino acid oxidase-like deaminating enzyme